jgi:DNA-directed RNA polymerase subunit omega
VRARPGALRRVGPCGYPPATAVPSPERPVAEFDVLRSKVDSTFHLVHLAAKRAREINAYYSHLGEGLVQYVPPLVTTDSTKALSIALEEIAAEKVIPVEPSETASTDPLALIDLPSEGGAPELTVVPGLPDLADLGGDAGSEDADAGA